MTIQMILALAILVIMIGLIMFDVLPFGAPPLLACMLLVVSGLSTVPEAFAGFTNSRRDYDRQLHGGAGGRTEDQGHG